VPPPVAEPAALRRQLAQPRTPSPMAAVVRGSIADFVAEASSRLGIPERWIDAVMRVESGGDASATSRVGAMGLMQVMPETYAMMRARLGLGADPYGYGGDKPGHRSAGGLLSVAE